jgi:hypothetical protein
MATAWIMGTIHNAIAPTISNAIQTAGSVAGDAVGAVGNGINGIGESINSSIRRYGDGTVDYGNAIKDYTKAPGPRASTASNPLGLSNSVTGGKNAFSQPIYRAPAPSQPKALPAPAPKPQPKALPAPAPKKPATGTAAKPAAAATKKRTGSVNHLPQNTGSVNKLPRNTQRPPTRPATRAGSRIPPSANKATGTKPARSGVPMGANKAAASKPGGSGVPLGAKKGPATKHAGSGVPLGAYKGTVSRGSTVSRSK